MLPRENGRDRWWTLALLVPGVNIMAYWIYAFTLKERDAEAGKPALSERAQVGARSPERVPPELGRVQASASEADPSAQDSEENG